MESGDSRASVTSNADIADMLMSVAQHLSVESGSFYKFKSYRRAAGSIRCLAESLDELVRGGADITQFPGIGKGIASAIREIVLTGQLRILKAMQSDASPEVASLAGYPRLDPRRVARVYKKLGISTVDSLRETLASGEISAKFGMRMAQHIQEALSERRPMLLSKADELRRAVEKFLLQRAGADAVQVVGDYRRRVEVIDEIAFVVQTNNFRSVVAGLERYGGSTALLSLTSDAAEFALAAGIKLRLFLSPLRSWGVSLITHTGSAAHLKELKAHTDGLHSLVSNRIFATEKAVYGELGLRYIEPELREGRGETDRAKQAIPVALVSADDICGELHAHSTSSDGRHSIEQMAIAANENGYEYIGITDHSQSLKLAGGLPPAQLWEQLRFIDALNERLASIRVLKSSEVDILANGSLDYSNDLLRELDYTVCSIHSHFAMSREKQTERLLRAMDNRYLNILGHATGRLLLKRPGYEVDMDRIIEHAHQTGCFFEINSSPVRLDLSAEHARRAASAGVLVAVNTDAHSTLELASVRCGIDQARRAGISKKGVLNCLRWSRLCSLFKR